MTTCSTRTTRSGRRSPATTPDRSLENTRNVGRIRKLVEGGAADPAAEQQAIDAAGRYGNWLGMDLGLHYDEGCPVPDGSEPLPVDRSGARPLPAGLPWPPGAPRTDGYGRWLHARSLRRPVRAAARLCVRCAAITGGGGAVLRVELLAAVAQDRAAELSGPWITATGAVLVRPDGHVAWRRLVGATPTPPARSSTGCSAADAPPWMAGTPPARGSTELRFEAELHRR
ncbi:MAG: hypothetical protein R2755_18585 [Acidimicrobiales bacterium]